MNEEEKELIKELERKSNLIATECEIFIERRELFTILNLIDKLQKEIENAEWYVNQMIIRLHEDIIDYIDDDKIRNQAIIGELKETKQEWLDVKKLLNGESIDKLYNDWRKYGEYE